MSQAAENLNPGFLMRMRAGRPWIRIKSAVSLDGGTALQNGDSKWISSEASRQDVQRWRARSSAILTGIGCLPLPAHGGMISLSALMDALADMEFNEVQVEAGPRLCGALLDARLVDEVLVYQAPVLLGSGAAGLFAFGPLESMADRTHLTVLETLQIGGDTRIRLKPEFRH